MSIAYQTPHTAAYYRSRLSPRYATEGEAYRDAVHYVNAANDQLRSMRELRGILPDATTGHEVTVVRREHYNAMWHAAEYYRRARRAVAPLPGIEVHLLAGRLAVIIVEGLVAP